MDATNVAAENAMDMICNPMSLGFLDHVGGTYLYRPTALPVS